MIVFSKNIFNVSVGVGRTAMSEAESGESPVI